MRSLFLITAVSLAGFWVPAAWWAGILYLAYWLAKGVPGESYP